MADSVLSRNDRIFEQLKRDIAEIVRYETGYDPVFRVEAHEDGFTIGAAVRTFDFVIGVDVTIRPGALEPEYAG